MNPDIKNLIFAFLEQIKNDDEIEIYNESSLQHELGFYLRSKLRNKYKVQFERNIKDFKIPHKSSPKKAIDISIFNDDREDYLATIELKFLKKEGVPRRMHDICEDIEFMEHTKEQKFETAYVLVIADFEGFYEGKSEKSPYWYFRPHKDSGSCKPLKGEIKGKVGREYKINLKNSYQITWHEIKDPRRYTLIEIP